MITDVLLEYKWLAPAVLLVMVLIGPILGARVAGHPRVAWLLAGISLLPVVALTLVPVQRELYGFCIVQWSLPTFGRVELLANVVLFVAPVLFASIASRRPIVMLVAGSALSALVEIFQALVPAIGRSCDTTDWLSNTIGAVIGALLAIIALRVVARQRPA